MFIRDDLILKIADSPALEALPSEVREEILRLKREHDRREATLEKERKDEEIRVRKERLDMERKLLCLGEWGEKVPLKRRFALCERIGKRFVGHIGQEGDPTKWEDEVQYCAIDLVRGIMSPYWAYFGASTKQGQLDAFYNERVRPALEKTGDDLVTFLSCEWNFFRIDDQPGHEKIKFQVLDYDVEKDVGIPFAYAKKYDKVVVIGKSEPMTWREHMDALRKEFKSNGKDND